MYKDTPKVIINRDSINPNKTDYFMLVSRLLFPLYLSVAIPVNIAPLRSKIS